MIDTQLLVPLVLAAGAAAALAVAVSRKPKPPPIEQPTGEPFEPRDGPPSVRYFGRDWQPLAGPDGAAWNCRGTLEDGPSYRPARDPITGIAGWYLPGNVGSPVNSCPYWHLSPTGWSLIDTIGNGADVHWGSFVSKAFADLVLQRVDVHLHVRLQVQDLVQHQAARYVVGFTLTDGQGRDHYLEVPPLRTDAYDLDPDERYDRRQKGDIVYVTAEDAAEKGQIQMSRAGDVIDMRIPVSTLALAQRWDGDVSTLALRGVYIGHEVRGPAQAGIRILHYELSAA